MRIPALAVAIVIAATVAAPAATPAPKATVPARVNVKDLQPKELAPTRPLHTEFVVEVNKYGQVARVKSVKPSHDQAFDAHMYGNALQAYIRTPDGHALAGSYRLTYDYDPKTLSVRRDVALVKAGGVNANAEGAANAMMKIAARNRNRTMPPAPKTPIPAPSVRHLPDLPQVMQTPSH